MVASRLLLRLDNLKEQEEISKYQQGMSSFSGEDDPRFVADDVLRN